MRLHSQNLKGLGVHEDNLELTTDLKGNICDVDFGGINLIFGGNYFIFVTDYFNLNELKPYKTKQSWKNIS